MKKLAIRLGTWGAALGMLAGIVELSFGTHIRPWIGNKENPFVLGTDIVGHVLARLKNWHAFQLKVTF